MSQLEPSRPSPDSSTDGQSIAINRREWIYRGVAGLAVVFLMWIAYRYHSDGGVLLLVVPLIMGAAITALRLPEVSGKVNSVENWLQRGSAKATECQGKFARFFQRPFFGSSLAIWRWTASIPDVHVRAGVRISTLMFVSGIAVMLLVMTIYVIVVIAVLLMGLALFVWILSLSDGSRSSGREIQVTRNTTDWFGRPKQEHFDGSGQKVGETRPDTDWFGRPKTVNTDAHGNIVGESKPDTDWLCNPRTVHTDTEGNVTGESRPDTDWLGQPKTVHSDAEGNIVGESREETDIFGRPQIVRSDK